MKCYGMISIKFYGIVVSVLRASVFKRNVGSNVVEMIRLQEDEFRPS